MQIICKQKKLSPPDNSKWKYDLSLQNLFCFIFYETKKEKKKGIPCGFAPGL